MRYVILGGSIAGLSAARAIREQDKDAEIVMVSAEGAAPYYRPLIPLLIDGSKQGADLVMPGDPLRQLQVNTSPYAAERVDCRKRTVYFGDRWKLAYDRLLIATGARPAVPKIAQSLSSKNQWIREGAATTLGKLGPEARVVAPILQQVLQDPEVKVREAAERALRAIGD